MPITLKHFAPLARRLILHRQTKDHLTFAASAIPTPAPIAIPMDMPKARPPIATPMPAPMAIPMPAPNARYCCFLLSASR